MTTYRPEKLGTALSDALAEAYAVAPTNVLIYHTLEIRHPDFIDAIGNPTAVRVVRDNKDLEATLESDAPLNPGEVVLFRSLFFDLTLPEEGDSGSVPSVTVTIDNVGKILIQNLDRATESQEPIQITYRPYLSTDLTSPHIRPVLTMTLQTINVDSKKVTAVATYGNLANRKFPSMNYKIMDFPGLSLK